MTKSTVPLPAPKIRSLLSQRRRPPDVWKQKWPVEVAIWRFLKDFQINSWYSCSFLIIFRCPFWNTFKFDGWIDVVSQIWLNHQIMLGCTLVSSWILVIIVWNQRISNNSLPTYANLHSLVSLCPWSEVAHNSAMIQPMTHPSLHGIAFDGKIHGGFTRIHRDFSHHSTIQPAPPGGVWKGGVVLGKVAVPGAGDICGSWSQSVQKICGSKTMPFLPLDWEWGHHTIYKNGDDWVMLHDCFTHINY